MVCRLLKYLISSAEYVRDPRHDLIDFNHTDQRLYTSLVVLLSMYVHKCHISLLFVFWYSLYINAGRYLLLRPPTETTHQFLATKAHFSADTLHRDRQPKAHVPRAAGIDFARVERGFHVLCPSCSRQAFLGRGLSLVWSVVVIGCPMDGRRARVHSQKLNKFMKFCCIMYLSPEERASMFLQVVGTHAPDAVP